MNRLRRLITIAGLLALAVAFTGCFTLALVQDDAATQADVMGDVSVDTTACGAPLLAFVAGPRAADAHDSLSDLCPSDEDALDLYFSRSSALPLPGQLLVSYRVPEGATAPGELTATIDYLDFREWLTYVEGGVARRADERPAPHTDHQITFRRSTDLDAKLPGAYAESGDGSSDLEKIGPGIDVLGDGEKLVSYVSVVIPGAVLGDLELETAFGLPSGTRPYAGPFEHLSMAGWRIAMTKEMLPDVVGNRSSAVSRRLGLRGDEVDPIAAATYPDRPIDCTVGASFLAQLSRDERVGRPVDELDRLLKRGPSSTLDITFCPWPKLPLAEGEDLRVDLDKAFAGTETATRDLDLRGSGETFVEQGNAATVPFSLVGAGPAGQKVDLTASISPAIPGLGDIKTEIDFPGAGTHGRSVEIKVPADAPARTYEVLLTAAKGDHTRTAKAGLVVLPSRRHRPCRPRRPTR